MKRKQVLALCLAGTLLLSNVSVANAQTEQNTDSVKQTVEAQTEKDVPEETTAEGQTEEKETEAAEEKAEEVKTEDKTEEKTEETVSEKTEGKEDTEAEDGEAETDKETAGDVENEETTEDNEESTEGKILIPDETLRAKLRNNGVEVSDNGYASKTDMEALETLTLYTSQGRKELDLTGLEVAVNLTYLNVENYSVKHTEKLAGLTKLEDLSMENCNLSDISFVKNLTVLRDLDLSNNQIQNIDALKNMTALEALELSDNQIQNIDALKNLTKLYYLDLIKNQIQNTDAVKNLTELRWLCLSDNQITDFTAALELAEKKTNLNVDYDGNPEKGMVQVFENSSYSDLRLLEGQSSWSINAYGAFGSFTEQVTLESKDTEIAEVDKYNSIIAKKAGTVEIAAKYAGSELTFNVVVEAPQGPVAEEDKVPDEERVESTQGTSVLKNGQIWNWGGEKSEKISGDEKVKNYVAHKVYRGSEEELSTHKAQYAVEEYMGLNEAGTLWNWKKNHVSDQQYQKVKVLDGVREIVESDDGILLGYITEDNVYHVWRYRSPENWEITEVGTVADISDVYTGQYNRYDGHLEAVKTDGKIISIKISDEGKLVTDEISFVSVKEKRDKALDSHGNLWQGEYDEESWSYGNWKLIEEGVSDFSNWGYLKDSVYYTYDNQKIAENVENLVEGYYPFYKTKDGTVYYIDGIQDGNEKIESQKYAENVKQFFYNEPLARALYINDKNELYLRDPEGKETLLMHSALNFYEESNGVDFIVYREDGSAWRVNIYNSSAPYKLFSADEMKEDVEEPSNPDDTEKPDDPDNKPSNPDDTEKPDDPDNKPSNPDDTEKPSDPDNKPSNPDDTEKPDDSDNKPSNPDDTEKPDDPDNKPSNPDDTEKPDNNNSGNNNTNKPDNNKPGNVTVVDKVTGISVSGNVADDTVVKADAVTIDIEEKITSLLEKTVGRDAIKQQKTYDIRMMKGNVEIQPDGSVTVSIPLPMEFSTNVKVFWTENGQMQDMNAKVVNRKVVFNTTHFSLYTIADFGVKEEMKPDTDKDAGTKTETTGNNTNSENTTGVPKTGDTASAAPYMASALAALGVCLAFAGKRRKRL